ncbi:MAG: Chromate resistance protein ChrB [Thermoplasmata archaeon]
MIQSPSALDRALLLGYRLPAEPSRYRVSVWRRLRRMGASPLHRALFLLPDSPLNRLRVADIAHDIENWGGRAWVFLGVPMAGAGARAAPIRSKRRPRRTGGSRTGVRGVGSGPNEPV